MSRGILVCTDLDRTLLPNGDAPESAGARELFARLAARPEVTLAFVSGRHLALVTEAISSYGLPRPACIIADVGSSIYLRQGAGWEIDSRWTQRIATDWEGCSHDDLVSLFADLEPLALQEADKQGAYKLSYYVEADGGERDLMQTMRRRLREKNIRASLTWSIDDNTGSGLLDVLPVSATKLGAVRYLIELLSLPLESVLFAGDSGNDLAVLCSDIPGVLVANATEEVRRQALRRSAENGQQARLYLANGAMGAIQSAMKDVEKDAGKDPLATLNGNYSAGILEGLLHYHPEVKAWLR